MRKPNGPGIGCLGAALMLLGPGARGEDTPPPREPERVVLKSLGGNLRSGDRVIDTTYEFLHYRVEQTQGDWLWLVAGQGTRGWARRSDVVPLDQALKYFSNVISRQPQSSEAYRMRGLAHCAAKDYRRAIRDASEAIRLEPSLAAAWVDRCNAKLQKLDLDGALADANEAIRLDPRSARAYQFRAQFLRAKGQYAQLRELLAQPRTDDHASPAAEQLKLALEDLDRAIQLDPGHAMLYVDRGSCWKAQGDTDRAIAEADEAIRLDPTLTFAYMLRGLCQKDRQRALDDADTVIRIDPKSPSAYFYSALVSLEVDDYDRALANCDEGMRLDPKDPSLHLLRGIVLGNRGQVGPAISEFLFHPMLSWRVKVDVRLD